MMCPLTGHWFEKSTSSLPSDSRSGLASTVLLICASADFREQLAREIKKKRLRVLKITIGETQSGSCWILQGQLAGPWVEELRKCWKTEHQTKNWGSCVVDLNDVTYIDQAGERLLRALCRKGAELVATGIYTKHLIEKVKTTERLASRNTIFFLLAIVLFSGIFVSNCRQAGSKRCSANRSGFSIAERGT